MMSGFFILETLAQGKKEGITAGRTSLVEEAKKKHILLSEYEVREILASMEQQGWVKIRRGRVERESLKKAKTFYKRKWVKMTKKQSISSKKRPIKKEKLY